jgi:hypothetical protein
MHQAFLKGLREIADVKLVAKYKNERIGWPYDDKIRIFIPDLHMFSQHSFDKHHYSARTNYIHDLLPSLVRCLAEFKAAQPEPDEQVTVYQQGDFLDPWRETPEFWSKDPAKYDEAIDRIIESNAAVWDEFTDEETVNAQFVLGNHDIDVNHVARISHQFRFLRRFFEGEDGKTVGAVMHGDLFSWFEAVAPEWIKQLAVYYLSPKALKDKNKDLFNEVKKHADESAKEDVANDKLQEGINLGILIDPDEAPADEWNVQRPGSASDKALKYLEPARKYYDKVNEELDYNIRSVFIGHTHDARIAVIDEKSEGNDNNDFFLLTDSGAWLKEFTATFRHHGEDKPISGKKAQLGVLSANEVRLYQLGPLA